MQLQVITTYIPTLILCQTCSLFHGLLDRDRCPLHFRFETSAGGHTWQLNGPISVHGIINVYENTLAADSKGEVEAKLAVQY